MPIPIFLAIAAGVAALVGGGAGVKGAMDLYEANDKISDADLRNKENLAKFKDSSDRTTFSMEELGKLEMSVAKDFDLFSEAFNKIKNRPEFSVLKSNAKIPPFDFQEIHATSVAAGAFLGAVAGGAAGAVFGTAAAAGTTAAVMALGTASTGTAIATLSGAAATNAALAAIGGGSLAVGGGGIALGTTILGAATLGVGLLVGGAIFAVAGANVKEKAENAFFEMLKNEEEINKNLEYFSKVNKTANKLYSSIEKTHHVYSKLINKFIGLVEWERDWNTYSDEKRLFVENMILVVSILHKLINTPLIKVTKADEKGEPLETELDDSKVTQVIDSSVTALEEIGIFVI